MNDFDDYVLLGFDIRQNMDSIRSVDVFVWPQSEDTLSKLYNLGYKENLVQLIDCDANIIENIIDDNSIAIAIAVLPEGLNKMEEVLFHNMIKKPSSPLHLLKRGWIFEGFDIADGDGYFSIFGIDCNSPKMNIPSHLFPSKEDADLFIEPATKLYPEHVPFVNFAVFTYRKR